MTTKNCKVDTAKSRPAKISQKFSKKFATGRPPLSSEWTADRLLAASNDYFDKCDARTRIAVAKDGPVTVPAPAPYSVEGLCVALGISRGTFLAWRKDGPLSEVAEQIHLRITANRVTGALDGTQNSSFAQFLLKNNDAEAYREKVEVSNSLPPEVADILNRSLLEWPLKH